MLVGTARRRRQMRENVPQDMNLHTEIPKHGRKYSLKEESQRSLQSGDRFHMEVQLQTKSFKYIFNP